MPKNNKSNLSPITKHLIDKEGVAPYIYADTKGLLTSGVGHLLTDNDIKAANLTEYTTKTPDGYILNKNPSIKTKQINNGFYKIDQEGNKKYQPLFNAVHLNGQPLTVSEDTVFTNFNKDLDSKLKLARSYIPNLDTLPLQQQADLVQEVYRGSLTNNKIKGSPQALKLIKQAYAAQDAGNYREANNLFNKASNKYLISEEYKTAPDEIRTRFEETARAIKHLGRQPSQIPQQQRAEQTNPAPPMPGAQAPQGLLSQATNYISDLFWNPRKIFGDTTRD